MNWLKDKICFRYEFAHHGGHYNEKKTYAKHRRWWLLKIDGLVEWFDWGREIPDWLLPPNQPTATLRKKTHFDDCNQAVEVPLTIKNLELSGKMKTPEKIAWGKAMIEKSKQAKRIDYQVEGHPSFD